jgi:AhpD family alkylhydroperoxidase
VPNLYATIAYSEHGSGNYLQLQNGKTSLSKTEKELVNLVVSQENGCRYCQSAHTVIGKMNGFTEEQILEIRSGSAAFVVRFGSFSRTDTTSDHSF